MTPLRQLRESRGLTLKAVAAALEWDTGNLSRAERFGCKSLERAAQLAGFYGGGITEMHILYPERFPELRFGTAPRSRCDAERSTARSTVHDKRNTTFATLATHTPPPMPASIAAHLGSSVCGTPPAIAASNARNEK